MITQHLGAINRNLGGVKTPAQVFNLAALRYNYSRKPCICGALPLWNQFATQ